MSLRPFSNLQFTNEDWEKSYNECLLMTLLRVTFPRRSSFALLICLAFNQACIKRASSPDLAASVNGRPITNVELEKQISIQFPQPADKPSDDQLMIQKLEVLRSMVDQEIMMQRAEKLGLMAVDADVDTKFAEYKSPYTQEEFQKQLVTKKMTAEDLKTRIRRDLSIEKLINKEISSQINISDKDVTDFYNSNKGSFNLPEPQIRLATILVSPNPEVNVRNLKNDKAQNEEGARKKIQMIEQRIRSGEDFAMIAQNYSEDPSSAPNGGDLGFAALSSLDKASPELRKLLLSMPPGQVSSVISTPEGFRILKVISKEPAGQRDLKDPKVQQTIRQTLVDRKDQLRRQAYYELVRNEAKVENYLANSIVEAGAKK